MKKTSDDEDTYERTELCFLKIPFTPPDILVHLFNAPKSPFVLLEVALKDKHKFLWINLKEKPARSSKTSVIFSLDIPTCIVAWDNSKQI